MRSGIIISGLAHIALILLAIWGLPRTEEDETEQIQFSEVDILSVAEFDALKSSAPEFDEIELSEIMQPDVSFNSTNTPEAEALPEDATQDFVEAPSEADSDPDVSALRQRIAEPDVALEVEQLPEQQETDTALFQQPTPPSVEAPRTGAVNLSRPPAPREAPRIDTTEAPRPPEETEPAEEEVAPTEPEEAEDVEVVEEEEPTAPEEATTEVTPDEENAAPPQLRPQTRPSNMAELVAQAEAQRLIEEEERRLAEERARREREEAERQVAEQPQPEEAQPEEDEADTIAALIDQANEQPAEQPAEPAQQPSAPAENIPVGPPMTQGEKEGLRFAVQSCWNVPDGIKGASDLRITVAVELAQDGTIVSGPELVSPSGSGSPEVQIAYEAARRAILRCGAKGFDLPAEKWGQWRQLEVTFDPGGMLGW